MLVVTLYDVDGKQHFAVHNCDGEDAEDVTDRYVVSQLVVETEDGQRIAGWHVGMPIDEDQVMRGDA